MAPFPADASPDSLDPPPGRAEPDTLPNTFIFAVTDGGQLWLVTGRRHSWLPGEDVNPHFSRVYVLGDIRVIEDVETQAIGMEVTLLARVGATLHTAVLRDGRWTTWPPLTTNVKAMGLANLGGELCACLVGSDGRLRLATRRSSGVWREVVDVMADAVGPAGGEPLNALTRVDCAGIGNILEIAALDETGRLWEATRTQTAWVPFKRVINAVGLTFLDIDANNGVGAFHVLGSTSRTQYHGARLVGGAWTLFGDLQAVSQKDPGGSVVGGGQASYATLLTYVQVTSLGQIWYSERVLGGSETTAYYHDPAWPDLKFVNVAATITVP
jgi:hypothetical protein